MTPKEKAEELVEEFKPFAHINKSADGWSAKQCALIAVENEYNSLREQLFNLRACKVIESEKVYLHRLQELIDQEQEVKQEIEKL